MCIGQMSSTRCLRTRRAFGGDVAGVEEEVVDFCCCCVVLLVLFCSSAFEDVDAADILLLFSMLSFSGAQFFRTLIYIPIMSNT